MAARRMFCFREVNRLGVSGTLFSAHAQSALGLLNLMLERKNGKWAPRCCTKPLEVWEHTGGSYFPHTGPVVLAKLSDEEIDALCGQIWGL